MASSRKTPVTEAMVKAVDNKILLDQAYTILKELDEAEGILVQWREDSDFDDYYRGNVVRFLEQYEKLNQ